MLRLLRGERGSTLVIFAFVIPLILILGTAAVDVGNWFVHKRHLQTQADAAAFAGGSRFALPCTGTVNTKVIDTARQYAGPSATANTGPFNPQVSGTAASQLHVLLNAQNYYGQGNDTEFGAYGGQPCANTTLDVKMTEKDLPWLFNWVGSGLVPTINAEARTKVVPFSAVKGVLPLGVPTPQIYKAQATITRCVNGASITAPSEVRLQKLPDALQTDPTMTLWAPDPATYPGYMVPVTAPLFAGGCSGTDYEGIDVNVQVSGSPNVTPSTGNCANKYVDCFDTVMLRAFKAPNGSSTTPAFGGVNLQDLNCAPGTPYWSSGDLTTLPCHFNAMAAVDWGTPLLTTGFNGTLTMKAGGGTSTVNNITTNGIKAFGNLDSGNGITEPQNVTIDWSWTATGGTWDGKDCTAANKPCKDSGTTVVHRANAGAASPIVKVLVTRANGTPLDSFDQSNFPASMNLVVGIESDIKVGQRRVLRADQSQGNQTLQCDPDYANGFDVTALAVGCKPLYAANSLVIGNGWEPCPTPTNQWFKYPQTTPWECTLAGPGLSPNQVSDGAAIRTHNCTSIQYVQGDPKSCNAVACLHRNYWSEFGTGSANDPALNPQDPRIVLLFIVPYGVFNQTNANDPVEVIQVAEFYVTGWGGKGGGSNQDPCLSGNPADETTASATIVGHFINIVGFAQGNPDPNRTCDPNSPAPCTVVLVR